MRNPYYGFMTSFELTTKYGNSNLFGSKQEIKICFSIAHQSKDGNKSDFNLTQNLLQSNVIYPVGYVFSQTHYPIVIYPVGYVFSQTHYPTVIYLVGFMFSQTHYLTVIYPVGCVFSQTHYPTARTSRLNSNPDLRET